MKTTISARKEQFGDKGDLKRDWFCVDAEGKTLGRLASEISKVLQGKHKPIYTPHVDTGDYVIVVNAEKIKLTGKKLSDKLYHHHTGYPGGIKSVNALNLLEKDPTALVKKAIKGMMPKNQLNRDALMKLKVYAGSEHPHQANQPQSLNIK
ncbi:MAG: 50S ribosomal protein L13 [Proteobacteria bacterium]|nr:50S ribosomal protein L13 [Pseudomonadota bacterium]